MRSKARSLAPRTTGLLALLSLVVPSVEAMGSSDLGRGGVFGSVEISMNSAPPAKRWASVLPSIVGKDFHACADDKECGTEITVRDTIISIRDLSLFEKLGVVNRSVNRAIRYQDDMENFAKMDRWATPRDVLERGRGDCEDYAILKMATLRASGVPMDDMSVVVLRDTRRNVHHAVLAVMTPKGYFILDNLNDKAVSDRAVYQYEPLYSVGSRGLWVHGFRRPTDERATATASET